MPYIKKEQRAHYDCIIEELVGTLQSNYTVGDLNYVISRIIWDLFREKPSYTLGNNLVGVLECVKQEFYRRKLGPYEDLKIKESGDI